jgi:hypothetical protein
MSRVIQHRMLLDMYVILLRLALFKTFTRI